MRAAEDVDALEAPEQPETVADAAKRTPVALVPPGLEPPVDGEEVDYETDEDGQLKLC